MVDIPADIFTEPEDIDPVTLNHLGPLRHLAGVWRSETGLDVSPKAEGPERQAYVEEIALQPIDPQANGPQLLYGLRYHQHIVKPGEIETFHDQVGYWLWEPATGVIMQSLTIPRGQAVLAGGLARPDATAFAVSAERGATDFGIVSAPFLEGAFRTLRYRLAVRILSPTSWSYDSSTVLAVRGRSEPFDHHDANTLVKVAEPTPNPLARAL